MEQASAFHRIPVCIVVEVKCVADGQIGVKLSWNSSKHVSQFQYEIGTSFGGIDIVVG